MSIPADDTKEIIEQLSGLYQLDPQEFERQSRAIITRTIASFPEHHRKRAQGLQFKIDCTLSKYKDPVARMNKMVEIFWKNFQQFHDVLHNPEKILAEREPSGNLAKVIPLNHCPLPERDQLAR